MKRNIALQAVWREAALATKPHVCECCGESEDTTVIQVHHVVAFKDCPSIGYSIENSSLLCCRCHAHIHSGRPNLVKPVEDKLNDNLLRNDWISKHRNDQCPDYSDPSVCEALRKELKNRIPPEYDTYGKMYYLNHRVQHIENGKKWYSEHKKEHNERTREYYKTHKEEMKKLTHDWYVRNREKVLQRTRAYAAARKEKYREYQRKYREKHRDRINEIHRLSRARVKDRQKQLELQNVS